MPTQTRAALLGSWLRQHVVVAGYTRPSPHREGHRSRSRQVPSLVLRSPGGSALRQSLALELLPHSWRVRLSSPSSPLPPGCPFGALASRGRLMCWTCTRLTSDLVQMIPTFESSALLANSMTAMTPSSVMARMILHTAKISSQFRMYRSVILRRAELISRRPEEVSSVWQLLAVNTYLGDQQE